MTKKDLKFWKQEMKISRENYRNSCEYAKRQFDKAGTTTSMNKETSFLEFHGGYELQLDYRVARMHCRIKKRKNFIGRIKISN